MRNLSQEGAQGEIPEYQSQKKKRNSQESRYWPAAGVRWIKILKIKTPTPTSKHRLNVSIMRIINFHIVGITTVMLPLQTIGVVRVEFFEPVFPNATSAYKSPRKFFLLHRACLFTGHLITSYPPAISLPGACPPTHRAFHHHRIYPSTGLSCMSHYRRFLFSIPCTGCPR